jgi:hypothetical protein
LASSRHALGNPNVSESTDRDRGLLENEFQLSLLEICLRCSCADLRERGDPFINTAMLYNSREAACRRHVGNSQQREARFLAHNVSFMSCSRQSL